MAKKASPSAMDIIGYYMDYVLENDRNPSSVYSFAKHYKIEETAFYAHFGTFEAIESHIFALFFDNTLALLEKDENYASQDAQNKLLSFYYTFFEMLTANRSYVLHALDAKKHKMKTLKQLSGLREKFMAFVANLDIDLYDFKNDSVYEFQQKSLENLAWVQLAITMKFWMDDSSASFEKTDIFIEKSVKASFDLVESSPAKSLLDFGKFVFQERVKTNRK